MKDMVYMPVHCNEVLHEGEYLDHKFVIMSQGTHPTAYVECKLKDLTGYHDERLSGVSVHGGFTYHTRANWPAPDGPVVNVLGWDYMHPPLDFVGFVCLHPFGVSAKMWTTQEIYEEVKNVIRQLIELEAKND